MQETDTRAAETSFCLPPDGGTLAGAQQREGGGEERHEAAHAAKRVKATRNQFSTIKESIYLTELANWRLTAGAAALGSVRFGFVATRLQLRLRLQLQVGQQPLQGGYYYASMCCGGPPPLAG